MVGQALQHGEALRLLELRHVIRHVDELALEVLLVDEGALQREVHEARHDRALHDGQLTQDQWLRGRGLQPFEHVARRRVGLVHLVDEQDARQVDLVQLLEDQLQGRCLLVVRLADDDGDISTAERGALVLREFDGARAIDEGVAIAEVGGGRGVEFDTHAVGARLGCCVADGGLVRHPALARDGAGAEQDGFEECGLAAEIGAHQCNAPRALRPSAGLGIHGQCSFDC